jgi:hypothetical protein
MLQEATGQVPMVAEFALAFLLHQMDHNLAIPHLVFQVVLLLATIPLQTNAMLKATTNDK